MTLQVGGLLKHSFSDFPGCVAAVVFTRGCNFRCPYCHNPELVLPPAEQGAYSKPVTEWSEEGVFAFLEKRRSVLDGVVLCGGEPTLQKGLIPFLHRVKAMGFKAKLDTNGSRPDVLKQVLSQSLVDFIAMDFKMPLAHYEQVAGTGHEGSASHLESRLEESIRQIKQSGVPYEFRTTAVRPLHTMADLVEMGQWVSPTTPQGRFILQPFVNGNLLDPDFSKRAVPFSRSELDDVKSQLQVQGVRCSIR